MQTVTRPAVRIICVDAHDRVLMLNWRDPVSGDVLWEPPGGGIEAGETPYDTAGRELSEETGLDPSVIQPSYVEVERDDIWKGIRFVGTEQVFVALYPSLDAPPLRPVKLTPGGAAEPRRPRLGDPGRAARPAPGGPGDPRRRHHRPPPHLGVTHLSAPCVRPLFLRRS